mgnify:CR=1 FL=1
MYYRSGLSDNTAWGSWVKLLDANNYSSTLDSRYYTESEVNSLLSNKLNTSDFNWTNLPGKLVAGNEFNIINAGFKESIYFNYLPINDRSKTATILGYNFGNGAKGYASITASGFIKTGSGNSYVLLGDGGHKLESALSVSNADTVDGVHMDWSTNYTAGNYLAIWDNNGNVIRPIPRSDVSIGNADKLDGHHETYFMRTLGVMGSDWNDNITAGCYKVQNPSKNTPGNYNFGMGLTLATENHNDGENRIC